MPQPITYVDQSRVRPGKLEELRPAIERLSEFIERENPYILSYAFYLDDAEERMTVVGVHPDSAALVHHMDVGDEEFRRFADLVEISAIDVYGSVDEAVMERLHAKAQALGRGTVAVHPRQAGFTR